MATLRCFFSSQTMFLVLNKSYYLCMNSHSTIKGKRSKVISKLPSFMTQVLRESDYKCVWDHSSAEWTVVLGTSYFWWAENEPLKEWSWMDLFLLGSAAKSMDSNSGISKLSTGLRDQCWFLHEILVLLRSAEKIPLISVRSRFHCLYLLAINKGKFQAVLLK